MSRTVEPAEFSVPPPLVRKMEKLARAERRTPVALLRDMLRLYERHRRRREEDDDAWVMKLIKEAEEEQATQPLRPDALVQELKAFGRDLSARAKKRGIAGKDVDRIIHEARKRWGTAESRR